MILSKLTISIKASVEILSIILLQF